jgi:hypothetical protein
MIAKGTLVKVLGVFDADRVVGPGPETKQFIGRVGRVVEVDTGRRGGVGQSPRDPFYVVNVPGLGDDGFWEEELVILAS